MGSWLRKLGKVWDQVEEVVRSSYDLSASISGAPRTSKPFGSVPGRDGSLRISDSCNPDFAPLCPPFVSRSAVNEAKMVHVGPMLKNYRPLEAMAVLLVPLGNFALNRFVICA